MEVVIHKRINILEKLIPKLDGLINNYHEATIFQDVEWLKNWWAHKRRNEEITPYIVEITENEETIGVIPMYLSYKTFANRHFRILKPAGAGVFNYLIPILSKNYCPQKLLKKAFDKIYEDKHNWDSICWEDIPEGSNLDLFLKNKKSKYVKGKIQWFSPHIKLDKDIKVFHKQISRKYLKGIFYNERKLNREGELHYGVVKKEEDIASIMDMFFEFHCGRWKFSPYKSHEERRLLMKTIKSFFERGLVHLSYLSHNGNIASVEIGLVDRETRYLYMGAMNPEFHKYSIGHIHMYKIIKDACIEGYEFVDFFCGAEEYKQKWGPINKNNFEYLLFNNSKESFLYRQINNTYYSKQFFKSPALKQLFVKTLIRGCTFLLKINDKFKLKINNTNYSTK